MDEQETFSLCRFCLNSGDGKLHTSFVDVNENVGQLFFELTQLKLKYFSNYTKICELCFKDLNHSIELKHALIEGQNELERTIKLTKIEIKIEERIDEGDDVNQQQQQILLEDETEDNDAISDIVCDDNDASQASNLAECPECLELFDQEVIAKHITKHLKESPFACDKCEYKTDKRNRLEAHCSKAHGSKAPARKRKKREDYTVRKQCSLCGSLVKNLVEHLKITHGQLKRYFCDYCEYKCYFRAKIERHMQRHIPKEYQKIYSCELCSFRTNRKDTVKSHMYTMHRSDRQKNEICPHCEKAFFTKSQLNTHIKTVHQKIKNHLCNHCGKAFYMIKELAMHEKRHFERTEKCNQCDNLFFCKSDLRRHQRNKHTSPKIACGYPECGKMFHSNSKLKEHIKIIHERLKEYCCKFSQCDSKFGQYNNLKRHMDTVHKAMRIKCALPDCKYSVSRKDKYKNHLLSQHKNLDEQTREAILKNAKYE